MNIFISKMKKDSKFQQKTVFNNFPLRYVAFETFMWNRPEILNLFYRKSLRFAILNCPRLGSIMNGKLGKRFICYLTGLNLELGPEFLLETSGGCIYFVDKNSDGPDCRFGGSRKIVLPWDVGLFS